MVGDRGLPVKSTSPPAPPGVQLVRSTVALTVRESVRALVCAILTVLFRIVDL